MSGTALTDLVHTFFAERIFGPDRQQMLAEDLMARQATPATEHDRKRAALEKVIADNEKRQRSLVRQLADPDDDDDPELSARFRKEIKASFKELEQATQLLRQELKDLQAESDGDDGPQDAGLIDAIPQLRTRLAGVPEELQRELYDAF
ncbi:hypothetical protein C7C46_27035 [Streptomyces tateyamensis]|uniref:Uncharacterized protein n=1 Tax=Streptomyces tateyamensis TaxID=565073 RepID=A0A2V4N2C8_9ACTN|nr:hypothetical protein C7C46_27035 [Streptomyces tateyamensis]